MKTFALIGTLALFAAPAAVLAQEYHYIDMTGTVQTIEASSASSALQNAPGIAPTSGVAVDRGLLDEGDSVLGVSGEVGGSGGNEYHYVDVTGTVQTLPAVSAQAALQNAPGIAPTSGVAVDLGVLDEGDSVLGE